MTTGAQMVAETRRLIDSTNRPSRNRLASGIAEDDTTLTVTYDVSAIQPNSVLTVGWEVMYVWAVDVASKTVTVSREEEGSTAAAHAAGANVMVNPRVTDFAIAKALNADLMDLSSPMVGLYQTKAATLTTQAVNQYIDLTGYEDIVEVLDARVNPSGPENVWVRMEGVSLATDLDTADFPSGMALRLPTNYQPGRPVRIRYKARFAELTAPTNDVEEVTGLPITAHDIPPLGAAIKLISAQEISRNDPTRQGDTRRSEEVPAGAVQNSPRALAMLRQQRIASESMRLLDRDPPRRHS